MSCMMESQSSPEMVRENLRQIRERIASAAARAGRDASEIRLMAVTKTVAPELVNVAIAGGVDLLGENRVQEYREKREHYDLARAEVHFIGHLQTNKVKYLADTVSMIESVSSVRLAEEINREMEKRGKKMEVLLEINIGREDSKSGFLPEELTNALETLSNLHSISVQGLMCIPPIGESERYFYDIRKLFVDIGAKSIDNINMNVLSMGMSADFEQAIQYGSNIVRVGTALFGKRSYQN